MQIFGNGPASTSSIRVDDRSRRRAGGLYVAGGRRSFSSGLNVGERTPVNVSAHYGLRRPAIRTAQHRTDGGLAGGAPSVVGVVGALASRVPSVARVLPDTADAGSAGAASAVG